MQKNLIGGKEQMGLEALLLDKESKQVHIELDLQHKFVLGDHMAEHAPSPSVACGLFNQLVKFCLLSLLPNETIYPLG